jgi:predicted nucleic acid-binding protein
MTPEFVLDASVAMSWFFKDETTPTTLNLLTSLSTKSALVPASWYLEVANVIAMAERKGRVSVAQASNFIQLIGGVQLEIDNDAPLLAFTEVLPLCRTHQLTSYDAVYLDLSLRRRLPLASLDEPLRKAAKKLGIKLLGK